MYAALPSAVQPRERSACRSVVYSARRRKQEEDQVNMIIGTLSFYAAGAPRYCRPEWRCGAPLSPAQEDLTEQVLANVLSISGRLSNSCGRTIATLTETFAGIAGLCKATQLNCGEPHRGRRSCDGLDGTRGGQGGPVRPAGQGHGV